MSKLNEIFLYFLLNFCFFQSKKLNWKNVFINKTEETKYFIFGTLLYEIDENKFLHFAYIELNDNSINKICYNLNFDNFQSFSMKYGTTILKKRTGTFIEFNLQQNSIDF